MLKAFTDMSYLQPSNTHVQEDSSLLFNHNIARVLEAIDTELSNEGKEHMKMHSKLSPYTIWMTVHELVNPGLARELGGMIWLLPVVGTRVEIDSEKD